MNLRRIRMMILLCFIFFSFCGIPLSADDYVGISSAPAKPSAYWLENGEGLISVGLQFIEYENKDADYKSTAVGGSLGYEKFLGTASVAFNGSAMEIESVIGPKEDETVINGGLFSVGGNLNFLLIGTSESTHLNFFGGATFTQMESFYKVDGTIGTIEVEATDNREIGTYVDIFGLQCGIQLYIPLTENIAVIPFGMITKNDFDVLVDLDDENMEDIEMEGSYTSKIVGFDIHLYKVSVTSLLQINPDDDIVNISASFNW